MRRFVSCCCAAAVLLGPAFAFGAIETGFIQKPWPKQRVRHLEVGRHEVRWREWASKPDGIFASARFETPLPRQTVWDLSNSYTDVGEMTPGVTAVRYLERTERRQVIQVDIKVLWKMLQLTFEVEQDPPAVARFRLLNDLIGDYRGVCIFEELPAQGAGGPPAPAARQSQEPGRAAIMTSRPGTAVEFSTWLQPSRPVPMGLVLFVERMTMLQAARRFLDECDRHIHQGDAKSQSHLQ